MNIAISSAAAVVLGSVTGPLQPVLITHVDHEHTPKFYGKRGGYTKRRYFAYSHLYRHKGRKKRGRKNYPPLKLGSWPKPSQPITFTETYSKPVSDALKSWVGHMADNAGVRERDVA